MVEFAIEIYLNCDLVFGGYRGCFFWVVAFLPQVIGSIWIYNYCCDKQARSLEEFAETNDPDDFGGRVSDDSQ